MNFVGAEFFIFASCKCQGISSMTSMLMHLLETRKFCWPHHVIQVPHLFSLLRYDFFFFFLVFICFNALIQTVFCWKLSIELLSFDCQFRRSWNSSSQTQQEWIVEVRLAFLLCFTFFFVNIGSLDYYPIPYYLLLK